MFSFPVKAFSPLPGDNFADDIFKTLTESKKDHSCFTFVTETDQQLSIEILKSAKPGLYSSVGAERAIFGFNMTPNATGLLFIDYDPGVILFNLINLEMIEKSKEHSNYINMRKSSSYSDLFNLLPESYSQHYVNLKNPSLIKWFQNLSNRELDDNLAKFSPLYDEESYCRVKKFSLENKIYFRPYDFGSLGDAKNLGTELNIHSQNISVLDISNLWHPYYSRSFAMKITSDSFLLGPISKIESLILNPEEFTPPIKDSLIAPMSNDTIVLLSHKWEDTLFSWFYIGIRFEELIDIFINDRMLMGRFKNPELYENSDCCNTFIKAREALDKRQ